MTLDRAAAERAVEEHVAGPLGLGVVEAADAVIKVANANMADAVRLISIRRGYDPREFCLVAFGGAGPLHGAALAEELSIPTVLVPPSPGITSALGCLLVDVRHDLSAMFLAHLDSVEPHVLEEEFGKLETEARERLTVEGVPEEQMSIQRHVDMRYLGQWRSLTVTVGSPVDLADAAERFHAEHERAYNYRRDASPVEIYRLSVRAVGVTPKPQLRRHELDGSSPVAAGSRPVHFDASGTAVETPVYVRSELAAGTNLAGPAVIDQLDSTTLVPPGWRAEVDEWLNIRMHREKTS
jgi:N-methylhydantoinase A